MMYRKLVELDAGGCSTEIDRVKLKRVAKEFKDWLQTVDPSNDPFGFLRWDLPLVDAALDGSLELPYRENIPHTRELGEGFLPRAYTKISAPFYVLICGLDLVVKTNRHGEIIGRDIVEKDGKRYAWAEFEESTEPPQAL